jgi:hypothetical protein
VLSLEVFKDRRCSTCTEELQKRRGCEQDITPFTFDGEKLTRCPLRSFKENPQDYSEWFRLYSFREKNLPAEVGGYYDQPNAYLEIMSEIDSASSEALDPDFKKNMMKEEDKKTEELQKLGIPITKKK